MSSSKFRMTRAHLVLLVIFAGLGIIWQLIYGRPAEETVHQPAPQTHGEASEQNDIQSALPREASKPQEATGEQIASPSVEKSESRREPLTRTPQSKPSAAEASPKNSEATPTERTSTASSERRWIVAKQTIKDLQGKVVYRGDIDLTETIGRIAAGDRLRFRNDGSVFQNRERRLPVREAGYYREWVHPTPELDGPGPQRIITGKSGEIYYTADHYSSFKKLK